MLSDMLYSPGKFDTKVCVTFWMVKSVEISVCVAVFVDAGG